MRKLFWGWFAFIMAVSTVLSFYLVHVIWESDLPLWLKIILT